MSTRSDAIQEVITRCQSITGMTVYRDAESFTDEEDSYPLINITVEESETGDQLHNSHSYQTTLPISIEAIDVDKTDDPFTSIENLLEDIKKAVMIDTNLSGKCKNFTYEGDSEANRQYGGKTIAVSVSFKIIYFENYCKED